MIPYGRQSIDEEDIDSVIKVLKSDFITQGPIPDLFEKKVASLVNAKFAVSTNSATSSLLVSCLSLGLEKNDILWTSPNSFVASANCALHCGAQVDFVDIDLQSGNISLEKLREKLYEAKKSNNLPKILIPVHFAGQPTEQEEIWNLSKQYGFKIIEDASHSIGSKHKKESVGSCKWSDITVFSFHPVKIITTGEGGMALTNDPILANRMRQHRSHGITSNTDEMIDRPENELWNYQQIRLGYNYRMTDVAASLGLSQLDRLQDIIQKRHQIADRYNNELASLPLQIPWQHPDTFSSYHLYIIKLDLNNIEKSHPQIHDELCDLGILVNFHYIPVYRQPFYEEMGFKKNYCPESERYHEQALSIPMYPTLLIEEQDRVISTLKKVIV